MMEQKLTLVDDTPVYENDAGFNPYNNNPYKNKPLVMEKLKTKQNSLRESRNESDVHRWFRK